jgi:hypothetical protein
MSDNRTARATRHAVRAIVLLTSVAALGACTDFLTTGRDQAAETLLADAFLTTPAGYASTENSYAAAESDAWRPERRRNGGPGGPFGAAFGAGPMGGGLGPDFLGGGALREGLARGPFGGATSASECAFRAAAQRSECPGKRDRHGLEVERAVTWKDAAGTVQGSPDATTHSMRTSVQVSGTIAGRDGSTRTVQHASDRLVTGLEAGSPARRVDGTSAGTERVAGTGRSGAFVAERTVADTTRGLVIPVQDAGRSFPTAGTVIRVMSATVVVTGQPPEASSWREQVTYDGTERATLVITRNGVTKRCTLPLPLGRPTCE